MSPREQLTNLFVQGSVTESSINFYRHLRRSLDPSLLEIAGSTLVERSRTGDTSINRAQSVAGKCLAEISGAATEADHAAGLAALTMSLCVTHPGLVSGNSFLEENLWWWRGSFHKTVEYPRQILANLRPPLEGRFTSVDVRKLNERFWSLVTEGKEMIVVTGLNGVGKSSAIIQLARFARGLGLDVIQKKFPDERSLWFSDIDLVLKGGAPGLKPEALQHAIWANALALMSSEVGSALVICDRYAATDSPVYLDENRGSVAMLAARESEDYALWCFVLDRHPARCLEGLVNRGKSPRIFEGKVESMAQALSGYVAMSGIDGTVFVNIDFPAESQEHVILKKSAGALISAIAARGIFQRALMKQRKCMNISQGNAIVNTAYNEWP